MYINTLVGSGNTLPVAAILAHSIATKGNNGISSTGKIMNGLSSHLKKEHIHHPSNQTVSAQSILSNIATSENKITQHQHSTIPPAWYTDGRMESNNQNPSISTTHGLETPLPTYIQHTNGKRL